MPKSISKTIQVLLGSKKQPAPVKQKILKDLKQYMDQQKVTYLQVFEEVLRETIKTEGVELYTEKMVALFNRWEGQYFSGLKEDPTNVGNSANISALKAEVREQVTASANKIQVSKAGKISGKVEVVSSYFLGIGSEGDKKSARRVIWAAFMVNGHVVPKGGGQLIWMDAASYRKFRPGGMKKVGRFGKGLMITTTAEAIQEEIKARALSGVNWRIHPQTGQRGDPEAISKAVSGVFRELVMIAQTKAAEIFQQKG